MKTYAELSELAPEEYLNWQQFGSWSEEQYQKGLRIGRESTRVSLSVKGVWGSNGKDGSSCSSYEGIGYHAGTGALMKGFIDSGVPIVVYRWSNLDGTWIQGTAPAV